MFPSNALIIKGNIMFFSSKDPKVEDLKIIIVGAGEVGFNIAQRLAEEHKQVIVIDKNQEALSRVQENLDVQTILGSGSSPSTLKTAGIENANIFLAVTDSDETNITATLFAHALAPTILNLARIRDEEYVAYPELIEKGPLKISMLVNPEEEIVRTIERLLTLPGAVEYGEFAGGKIRLVGMRIEEGPLLGKQLYHFRDIVNNDGIMVGAISRHKKLIIPNGSDSIQYDDIVYFIYKSNNQKDLLRVLNKSHGLIDMACITGGGNIGVRLAKLFEQKNIDVKLIDINEDQCKKLADKLKSTLVLHGDGTDKTILEEEHIDKADAFIAVTGNEEANILSCLLARSLGVKEVVARINKPAYLHLVEAIGINHSVSPRLSAVNSILHYIRQGGILSTLTVGGEAAEIIEVLVPQDSKLIEKPVRTLGFPPGALLLTILRGNKSFIPSGQTIIKSGDRIVIICLREVMNHIEQLLTTSQE